MQKQLLIVSILLISLMAVAFFGLQSENVSSIDGADKKNALVKASFDSNTLKGIKIIKAQQTLFQSENINDVWLAQHLDSGNAYPVSKSSLSQFVQDIVSANLVEEKSRLPANHARLHLLDTDDSKSKATLVTLEFANGQLDVLLGKTANLQVGQYARYLDDDQMWLLDKQISLPTDEYSWLAPNILSLTANDIISVRRIDAENNWSISKVPVEESDTQGGESSRDDFILEGFDSSEEELRYVSVVNDYVDNILSIDFAVVKPFSPAEWTLISDKAHFEIVDSDQRIHSIELVQNDDVSLIHVKTFGEQSYVREWLYEVSDYQAREMNKIYTDFLVDRVAPNTE